MSNSNGKATADGKAKGTKATRKAVEKVPNLVIQDRLMTVLSKHKDGLAIEEAEAEGQKLKVTPKGRYAGVARSEFTTKKEGEKLLVFPSVSEHGFLVGIKHTVGRESMHWTVRTFPKQALEAAEKLEASKKLTGGEIAKLEVAIKRLAK